MPGASTFRVEWTRAAATDLTAIIDYISEDSIETALLVLEKIKQITGKLATLPFRGRLVPELAVYGIQIYRELIYLPWRIIYRVSGKKVFIMAVLDSRRNLEDILLERLVR